MEPFPPSSEIPEPSPAPPRRKGHPVIAWIVIFVVGGIVVYLQAVRPSAQAADKDDRLGILQLQMQARLLVGAASLGSKNDANVIAQVKNLETGPLDRRWRAIVLTGEIAGPSSAREQLHELDHKLARHGIQLDPTQKRLRDTLDLLYQDYEEGQWDAPSLLRRDREFLQSQLGWFGALALAPAAGSDPQAREEVLRAAYRTLAVVAAAVVGAIALGGLGFLGLLVLFALWGMGIVRGRLGEPTSYHGIYAETFAVWMVTYLGLSLLASLLPLPAKPLLVGPASLAVLAWPVLRGIPWRQVRQDVGLTLGPRPALEPAVGVGCYAMALPLVAAGAMLTLVLMQSQAGTGPPGENFGTEGGGPRANPAVDYLIVPGWWSKIEVLILASVIAPLVEETLFRGVLYRHLRDATRRLGGAGSALLSATVVNFVFAAVHPQGLLAVPLLMMLAYALTLAREWRGTLLPSMVTHGVSNGLVLTFFLLAFGD
jgi:membrane protease YdiL (CAAX protease family)